MITKFFKTFRFTFAASNPAVFTNGNCFLDWIAEQYNLNVSFIFKNNFYFIKIILFYLFKPPVGWVKPASCSVSTVGNRRDKSKNIYASRITFNSHPPTFFYRAVSIMAMMHCTFYFIGNEQIATTIKGTVSQNWEVLLIVKINESLQYFNPLEPENFFFNFLIKLAEVVDNMSK